jgi:hypothetical protein
MKTNENQNQQGDVLLEKIDKLPSGVQKVDTGKTVILAEGETTGHYHGIEDKGVLLYNGTQGKRYVHNTTKKAVTLTHQEHKPITVDPGIWEIGIVREHDYFQDMERKVVD